MSDTFIVLPLVRWFLVFGYLFFFFVLLLLLLIIVRARWSYPGAVVAIGQFFLYILPNKQNTRICSQTQYKTQLHGSVAHVFVLWGKCNRLPVYTSMNNDSNRTRHTHYMRAAMQCNNINMPGFGNQRLKFTRTACRLVRTDLINSYGQTENMHDRQQQERQHRTG